MMSEVTATTRRVIRKFTDAQGTQIVAESFSPGAVVTEVAQRHGVRPNLLPYWRMLSRTTGRTAKSSPVPCDATSWRGGTGSGACFAADCAG
jgi:transposase-like protein